MIEQTDMVVTGWDYFPPAESSAAPITNSTMLDVMRKRAATKKGLACRFTCSFVQDSQTILIYVAEDSYVIDFEDVIDKGELLNMIRNSFSKFKEKFELRKLGSVLHDHALAPLDEYRINLDAILPLLV